LGFIKNQFSDHERASEIADVIFVVAGIGELSVNLFRSAARNLLQEALIRDGRHYVPERLRTRWTSGQYDYEVRIHQADLGAPAGSNSAKGTTYRVSRRLRGTDASGQGNGWEFADQNNNWFPEKDLKSGKNLNASNDTHIPVPKLIQ
jgi:hypothetical protein